MGDMKHICVVGTGYVGLVTGTCLADLGNEVVCLDIVPEKVAQLQSGRLPIYEPGLEPLVAHNVAAGRLRFTTSYADAVAGKDFIFIAVNTPTIAGGAGADMRFVEAAACAIAENVRNDVIVVNKSTMPVGSGDLVAELIQDCLVDRSVRVAVVSNPEFLREGSAVHDFLHPDRVVLGSVDHDAAERVSQLYLPLRVPIMITDIHTAEMIKYASNAFLATKISFINEIARICDRLGADVREVAAGMGYDRRIGPAFLDAGLGFGGSCFPKDVKALAQMAHDVGLHPQMLDAVMMTNHSQRRLAVELLANELGGEEMLRGSVVAVLGLAFKEDTDDMREAPSIDIVRWLVEAGTEVRVHDPIAIDTARQVFPDSSVLYCADPYEAVRDAQAVILVTGWKQFRHLDYRRIRDLMPDTDGGPIFVDGRNLLDPIEMWRLGFRYHGIGRAKQRQQASARRVLTLTSVSAQAGTENAANA